MADYDLWACPYTGGQQSCNPECKLFRSAHTRKNDNKVIPNYCRKFGRMDKDYSQTKEEADAIDEVLPGGEL